MMDQGTTTTSGTTSDVGPMMFGSSIPAGMMLGMWVTIVLVWVWLAVGIAAMLSWMSHHNSSSGRKSRGR